MTALWVSPYTDRIEDPYLGAEVKTEGPGAKYGVVHFLVPENESASLTLMDFLLRETDESAQRLEELLWLGAIYVNRSRVCCDNSDGTNTSTECTLKPGDRIRAHLGPRRFYGQPGLSRRIIKKTEDYILVDKPAGLPVHALVDNARENLLSLLEVDLKETLFITHRLDVETSGMIVIARNKKTQSAINKLIAARRVKRLYYAWVETSIEPGSYVHYMESTPIAPKTVVSEAREGWLHCELTVLSCEQVSAQGIIQNYKVIAENEDPSQDALSRLIYRLEIELGTGRTQQIRSQLAHMGAPILGDWKYGSSFKMTDIETNGPAIGLRAHTLDLQAL